VGLVAAGASLAALVHASRRAEAGAEQRGKAPAGRQSGVGTLLTALALVVAVRRARTWPALGSRYDAPGARAAAPAGEQDLWRALDEGHDPTAEDDASRP
jgi:hypothetical protein